MKKILSITLLFLSFNVVAATIDSTRVLIVTAHPDDESGFAATVYKITHELGGAVDLAVITNGEAGYKYSSLAESYYHLKLTNEETGRKYLPTIRKKELMLAGDIIGIGKYFFFDQQDNHFTLDVDTVFREVWDVVGIKRRLTDILSKGNYDFIFCLLPTPDTHGHHKGATILALQTVSEMQLTKKPIILGASVSSLNDSTSTKFKSLPAFPVTTISSEAPRFSFDRNESFGFKNALNYKIIVNWEIAEHKSQGSMQTYMGRGDFENFWYFDMNPNGGKEKAEKLFQDLKERKYKGY